MPDLISSSPNDTHATSPKRHKNASADDAELFRHMELLFFAYRDFTSDPDKMLEEIGFGRAHHRVLHFVTRHPGMCVADLLHILTITKQSLGRVLKQLVNEGYVRQQRNIHDRRERLLYPTEAGCALSRRLAAPQLDRLANALAAAGTSGQNATESFLFTMITEAERSQVARVVWGQDGRPERQTKRA